MRFSDRTTKTYVCALSLMERRRVAFSLQGKRIVSLTYGFNENLGWFLTCVSVSAMVWKKNIIRVFSPNDNRGIRTLALSDQIGLGKPDSGALDHSAMLPWKFSFLKKLTGRNPIQIQMLKLDLAWVEEGTEGRWYYWHIDYTCKIVPLRLLACFLLPLRNCLINLRFHLFLSYTLAKCFNKLAMRVH